MKIFLSRIQDDFHVAADDEPDHPAARSGLRGWAERKLARLLSYWQHSTGRLALALRRLWDWLNRRAEPDESVLVRLRHADTIEVHHPPDLTTAEARSLWKTYLQKRWGRHLPWFVVNALISPFTILLAPLPGPNLVGYWFVYRAIRHLLILLGLRKARSERAETSFHPQEALPSQGGGSNGPRHPAPPLVAL